MSYGLTVSCIPSQPWSINLIIIMSLFIFVDIVKYLHFIVIILSNNCDGDDHLLSSSNPNIDYRVLDHYITCI